MGLNWNLFHLVFPDVQYPDLKVMSHWATLIEKGTLHLIIRLLDLHVYHNSD